jgi:MFS family permease
VAGWATGGLIFGAVGDRIGRAKTLTITVLIYSLCTGLSAFSKGWVDFAFYRFLTGLGVGGVFGLAVALVADSVPDSARTGALGSLQALSTVGNIMAGLVAMGLGALASPTVKMIPPADVWKYMFLIGAIPAFLCIFIQLRLKEPEKWVAARASGQLTGVKFGSYASLFGDPRWREGAIRGMLLSVTGVIGLWGIGFFSPELVGSVIGDSLKARGVDPSQIAAAKAKWTGINQIVFNVGGFLGMMTTTVVAQRIGRKVAFVAAFAGSLLATVMFFRFFNGIEHIWMSFILGFFQLSIFAGLAIYLPELFPTRLRSTGTSFCYNVGRFIAATGPFTLGLLQKALAANATTPAEKLTAFRDACTYMSAIFIVGILIAMTVRETKGQPLPED